MSRARAGGGGGAAAAESAGLTHGFSVSSNAAGVKVYNLTAGKSIPEFLTPKQRRRLNQQAAFRNRIELLQDFEFPTSSTCARFSRDGAFCKFMKGNICNGTYLLTYLLTYFPRT